MYNGWATLAGTELFNAARTMAYVQNMTPGLQFNSCWESEGLDGVLGDGLYRTPALDPAPWFSESSPGSEKFLGFYPLSITGVEDPSRTVTVTELVQDGGIFSNPRRTTKEFRVRGVLIGTDGEGLAVGRSWLTGAVKGSNCSGGEGNCAGDPFCYMAYLPKFCDYANKDLYPTTPVDWKWSKTRPGQWHDYADGNVSTSGSNGVLVTTPCEGDGAQWVVNGLIPGEWYRVAIDMNPGTSKVMLDVAGHTQITSRREAKHVNLTQTEWVLDFIATNESQGIRVVKASGGCNGGAMRIYGMHVKRLPERRSVFLPRFTADNFSEPSSWSWTQNDFTPGESVNLALDTATEYVDIKWINHDATSHNIGAYSGVARLIRGLTPGRYYTAYVKMAGSNAIDDPYLNIVDGANVERKRLGYNWYSVTFQARAAQHYLRIFTNEDFTLTGNATEYIRLFYLRVDQSERTLPLQQPNQALPALRSLHGVTLLEGPKKVTDYRENGSARLEEVEFSFAVARPYTYGVLERVNTSLNYTTYLVGNDPCVNGELLRRNLYTNPDNNPSGSSTPRGGLLEYGPLTPNAATLDYSTGPTTGNATVRIIPDGSGTDSCIIIPESNPLTEGLTYTVSATFEQASPQEGTLSTHARQIAVSEGAGIVYSEQALNTVGRQRLSVSFVMTGTLFYIRLYNGSNDSGDLVHWSEILIEQTGVAGQPFSGAGMENADSRADLSWEGTAHQSVSVYQRANPAVIRDPDCVTPPTAPQPVGITPECASDVETWRRYWMEIPSRLAGGWNESVPVITLTTGSTAIRDVRVRFYPNPFEFDITQIASCDYCGEFLISYVPPNAVMTIDAINMTAMADVRGTGQQRVMHLISDSDYGPIKWPEMTCDMPYFMTVDIAPDEILNVDIGLSVALKE